MRKRLIDRIDCKSFSTTEGYKHLACIKGTGINCNLISDQIIAKKTNEELLKAFPILEEQDVRAAKLFTQLVKAQHPGSIVRLIKKLNQKEPAPPKTYLLDVQGLYDLENGGLMAYYSKGHQDKEEFLGAVMDEYPLEFSINSVTYEWGKWEFQGESKQLGLQHYTFRRSIRGEFPITYIEI